MTLIVRIEVAPDGDRSQAYEIGRIEIINVGATGVEGQYTNHVATLRDNIGETRAEIFYHCPADGAFSLIADACATLYVIRAKKRDAANG